MQKNKRLPKWLFVGGLSIITLGILSAVVLYFTFLAPNVTGEKAHLYIPTGSSFESVIDTIETNDMVKHDVFFKLAARLMSYPENVRAGRYALEQGMSNRALIRNLRSGNQEAIRFRFENVRLKETFAGLLGNNFEADSATFTTLLNDSALAENYGFDTHNFFAMFIPNTYEIYWNTTPESIFARFHDEYNRFWTTDRKEKAKKLNLTPQDVIILASIVKGEALHTDEMPDIAGLYLNRLERGMLLQADPTVIFANNDFTIRRVLNKHLRFDSPYNTYIYKGIPPGPIMMPSIASIDAVLNHNHHNYLYMCAKDDFSGYHNFATNIAEHQVNARKFQRALDARNIKK